MIIFWEFLMFELIFLSSKVKRSVTIISKHGIYRLPYKLPNDLRPKTKYQEILKTSQNYTLVFCWNENFVKISKKFLKGRNWTFPIVPYFTWKLEFASNILSMVVDRINKLSSFFISSWPILIYFVSIKTNYYFWNKRKRI